MSNPEPRTPVGTALSDAFLRDIDHGLAAADVLLSDAYPGDPGTRQPVHTVYVPADRVTADTATSWGSAALDLLEEVVPDAASAADITGLGASLTADVHARTRAKLSAQPVEDLRIDLEDGYGARPEPEEDAAAQAAATILRTLLTRPDGPSFGGIRFKSFEQPTRRRGIRSLDLFLAQLIAEGPLPDGLVLTLPKVTSIDQIQAMVSICRELETAHRLPERRLRFEIQVETPQAILAATGAAAVATMIHAADHRAVGLHYGTYDYSASCGIAAEYQALDHPVADYAKAVMQVAAAGTGVRLSDGSTNVTPVGTPAEIHAAMALHARLTTRSLVRGYYQGWDMHPGHLITRYLATYAFYQHSYPAAASRLRAYLSGQAGAVMDEPATAAALAGFIVRGVHCGALDADSVERDTGTDLNAVEALARRAAAPSAHDPDADHPGVAPISEKRT